MLTVACFVFRGKAGGGSDEDADCGMLYVQEQVRMLTVVCLCSEESQNADWGVLCV